ncbi:FAD-binding and (Fe-S)-binding domain-containing protein [Dermatophilaceae bacterium Soc4.6]
MTTTAYGLADFAAALADPSRLRTGLTDRLKMAHDASHYALTPQAVAIPVDAREVGRLFAASGRSQVPLTFRSGGTSLSGQAGTSGVLVDSRRYFREIEVLDGGARVRVGPGATVRAVNARLVRHGRKLGPDPASEVACTLGGVVANNSSGMACGTQANTYATLDSLVVVLPSGTVVDSGAPDADERLRSLEPALHEGLGRLRDRVRGNPDSVRRIEAQFSMKNTMGYGVNAFVDHTRPVDILAHLVVGSEGTLAFIASVVLRTVPLLAHAVTGLLVFDDLAGATGALPTLLQTGPATVELMDAASLRVGQADPAASAVLRGIEVVRHAALLVEYQADSREAVTALADGAVPTLARLLPHAPPALTADPEERASLWHTRKGLYATVAGARPAGTTALLEDVAVPVEALLPTCESLIGLFARHGYDDAVIFGHAKDGNIHFMLTERLGGADSDRLQRFTDDMVDLVLGADGSLKAEHGTGRMMAPYVRRQYGDELYDVMWQVKRLCDPGAVLNPGVVLNDDPQAHLRDLKAAPTVEAEVDRCVECGYCEPVCPSRDLTTTPRQRIAIRREMVLARERGDLQTLAQLEADEAYESVDTCAVDGMCQTACPVHINTGDLMKRLRSERAGPVVQRGWTTAARHWAGVTRVGATALTATSALPAAVVTGPNRLARRLLGDDVLPLWAPDLPAGGPPRPTGGARVPRGTSRVEVVAFSACVGTMFGPSTPGGGVGSALERLCAATGVTLRYPDDLPSLCCGTPWRSKGMTQGAREMEARVLESLWRASDGGRLEVVCDASSCTEGLRETVAKAVAEPGSPYGALRVVDAVTFVAREVLPVLPTVRRIPSLALHPTCSTARMGIDGDLRAVAAAVADEVVVPDSWGCCAFAGDRGMLHPELTASATTAQAAEVLASGAGAHASSNRTCELGMSRATGKDYRHVLELLADAL